MRIKQASLHPYRLALKSPWKCSRGIVRFRDGCLIKLLGNNGIIGWGDYAPLAPHHSPFYQAGLTQLADKLSELPHHPIEVIHHSPALRSPPAQAALECALLDLEARTSGRTLAALLGIPLQTSIVVNSVGGALDELAHLRAQDAAIRGFATIKFKVGMESPLLEAERLREIQRHCQGCLSFRLDANGAWEFEEAQRFIEAVLDLPIDMIEEPLRHPEAKLLHRLQSLSPFPLALDESLLGKYPGQSEAQLAVRRLVLKPSLLGGPLSTLRWIRDAHSRGLEIVLTSALESAIGLSMVAHLAALLPELPCHGLATSEWMQDDVAALPLIQGGRLRLPAGHGLGINPTQEGLQHV